MITRLAAHMKNKTTGAFLGYFENSVLMRQIFISASAEDGAPALTT
ncbi:Uncharacterised protein [Klebsiella pneumoniae]|uniref:Uncharacterized protein n=1 Tax=Klebsiella pneumoniae TaxID=573 RepID=A0A2X3CCG1_KLEPN|nr:Uncharacterised protein [Klebsiella pneumoniae]